KWQSDANFERCTRFVLRNTAYLRPALGSHNVRSLAHGIAAAKIMELPPAALELQMLYGMADAEKHALVERGQRLRIYMPYGELIPGMAYLVRRLLENTSNDSFLRAGFVERVSPEDLLANPAESLLPLPLGEGGGEGVPSISQTAKNPHPNPLPKGEATANLLPIDDSTAMSNFTNQPPVDFAQAENRAAML